MPRLTSVGFPGARRQLRAELTALAVALGAAALLAALDLQTKASAQSGAPVPSISGAEAVERAAAQGVDVDHAEMAYPVRDVRWGRGVWVVGGADRAFVDATSGELLEIEFGSR
jgi:hypothetical protein